MAVKFLCMHFASVSAVHSQKHLLGETKLFVCVRFCKLSEIHRSVLTARASVQLGCEGTILLCV